MAARDSDQLGRGERWMGRGHNPQRRLANRNGFIRYGYPLKINVISQLVRTVIADRSRRNGMSFAERPVTRERSAITVRTSCDITLIFYGYPYRMNPLRFARRLWGLWPRPIQRPPRSNWSESLAAIYVELYKPL
jgi:hypothetical protein